LLFQIAGKLIDRFRPSRIALFKHVDAVRHHLVVGVGAQFGHGLEYVLVQLGELGG